GFGRKSLFFLTFLHGQTTVGPGCSQTVHRHEVFGARLYRSETGSGKSKNPGQQSVISSAGSSIGWKRWKASPSHHRLYLILATEVQILSQMLAHQAQVKFQGINRGAHREGHPQLIDSFLKPVKSGVEIS